MSVTTPQKQMASTRLLQVDVDDAAPDGYPAEGVSRTPGSPTKQGGRTMWTHGDDDDDDIGGFLPGVSGTNGNTESESVIKQVTHSDGLAASVYGTSAQPTSFKRKPVGVDGRAVATGGGGGGLFGMLCCIPSRKDEQKNVEVRVGSAADGKLKT